MRSQLAAAAPGPGVLLPHWHCDSEFGPGVGGSDSGRAEPMVWGKVGEAEVDCGVAAGPHGPVVNDGLGHLYGGLSLWT